MKSNFLNLYKITLFNTYNKGAGKKRSKLSGIVTSIIIYAVLFILVTLYSFIGLEYLKQNQVERYFPIIVYAITVLMTFMLTINKSKSTIFDNKYNELLFAMPIKSKTVLSTRLVTLLTMNYITTLVVLVPALIVFGILLKLNALYYIFAFLVITFTPFLPVTFAAFIGYLIAFISSKVKNAAKLVETLFTFIFFIIFFICYSFAGKIFEIAIANVDKIDLFVNKFGFVLKYVTEALVNLNVFAIIKFVTINLLFLIFFIWALSFSYFKISSNLKEKATRKKLNRNIEYSKNSVLRTLTIKELKTLFSIPTYIFNSLFGAVIIVIVGIATFFLSKEKIFEMINIGGFESSTTVLVLAVFIFLVSMSNTTCASISLEGNKLWIIKSLPIDPKKVLNSKILTNIITVLIPTIFSLLIMCFNFKISIIETFLILIITVVLNIICSQFGLLMNLAFPKLDFESEIQAIKQSTSSFITVFTIMIFSIIVIALAFILSFFVGNTAMMLIILTLLFIISFLEKRILNKYGVKKLMRLSN